MNNYKRSLSAVSCLIILFSISHLNRIFLLHRSLPSTVVPALAQELSSSEDEISSISFLFLLSCVLVKPAVAEQEQDTDAREGATHGVHHRKTSTCTVLEYLNASFLDLDVDHYFHKTIN